MLAQGSRGRHTGYSSLSLSNYMWQFKPNWPTKGTPAKGLLSSRIDLLPTIIVSGRSKYGSVLSR